MLSGPEIKRAGMVRQPPIKLFKKEGLDNVTSGGLC